MSRTKKPTGSGPQNRGADGRFLPGYTHNPGGRKQKPEELKEFCRNNSMAGLEKLRTLLMSPDTTTRDATSIVRLFLEYGYGKPSNDLDRERFDLDKRIAEAQLQKIASEDIGVRGIDITFSVDKAGYKEGLDEMEALL